MDLISEVKKEFMNESEKEKLYQAINYDENDSISNEQFYPLGVFYLFNLIK